ncbi:MAG: NUDIX domain-containing protein [Chloroflexi bacterium]|nr:NUDIX domain-containing protein [Chloroflexota bacterium]
MCSAPLEEQLIFDRMRPACPDCGFIHFQGPKLAAGAIPVKDGRVLLCRRAIPPRLGLWNFPAGYVDLGETIEDAAVREVREETLVEVRLDRLLGIYSRADDPVVLVTFIATVVDGDPAVGHETSEVGLFPPGAYPELAFWGTKQALDDWERSL